MKKGTILLVLGGLAIIGANASHAGEWTKQCSEIKVPFTVYEKQKPSDGDVITGMIIGGILGGTATNSDEGAAVGAIVGGIAANEKTYKVTKYKNKTICNFNYIPAKVNNELVVGYINALNAGQKLSTEVTRDVQHTVGVKADGVWGVKSREAAISYVANLSSKKTETEEVKIRYGVEVNGVVVMEFHDMQRALELIQHLNEVAEVRFVINP